MPRRNQTPRQAKQQTPHHPTVLEHIQELRSRLFWVVAFVIIASSGGYAIKDQMLAVLTHPLGNQQLYYLTPIGGLSFIIKLCFYFGILAAVPLIVYHIYRYLQPLMGQQQRSVMWYFLFSLFLALAGIGFAYFVSLPAALHFLTDFNIDHITAMLTVDAYLTFVTSYLLGAALLFQIPLLLLIIDKITPLTPGGLMKYQRHVVLVAFILAAIISPTPDIINQALLAVPIIAMYQFGILLVWWQHARRKRMARKEATSPVYVPPKFQPLPQPVLVPQLVEEPMPDPLPRLSEQASMPKKSSLINDFAPRRAIVTQKAKAVVQQQVQVPRQTRSPQPLARTLIPDRRVRIERPNRLTSIDGIIAR